MIATVNLHEQFNEYDMFWDFEPCSNIRQKNFWMRLVAKERDRHLSSVTTLFDQSVQLTKTASRIGTPDVFSFESKIRILYFVSDCNVSYASFWLRKQILTFTIMSRQDAASLPSIDVDSEKRILECHLAQEGVPWPNYACLIFLSLFYLVKRISAVSRRRDWVDK